MVMGTKSWEWKGMVHESHSRTSLVLHAGNASKLMMIGSRTDFHHLVA